jgi:hypothetical protein
MSLVTGLRAEGYDPAGLVSYKNTPDLSRRSDSPRRNGVKTGAKADGNQFLWHRVMKTPGAKISLGWTIGAKGV